MCSSSLAFGSDVRRKGEGASWETVIAGRSEIIKTTCGRAELVSAKRLRKCQPVDMQLCMQH